MLQKLPKRSLNRSAIRPADAGAIGHENRARPLGERGLGKTKAGMMLVGRSGDRLKMIKDLGGSGGRMERGRRTEIR